MVIKDGDIYSISKDMSGVCRLTLKNAKLEDSGEYSCKINKQNEKTETTLKIIGKKFKMKFFSNSVLRSKSIFKFDYGLN